MAKTNITPVDRLSYKQLLLDKIKFQRSGTTHGSAFNNFDYPGAQFFRLLFHFYNDPRNGEAERQGSGLLHPTWQMGGAKGLAGWDTQKKNPKRAPELKAWRFNSAYSYLIANDEMERAIYLKQFISLLSNINSESPWYFKSVKGLDAVIERKQFMEDFQFKERGHITIECIPDSADQRIGTLMDLYRAAAYSWVNKREVIPTNLRKFDMSIVVFEVPIAGLHMPTSDKLELSDLLGNISALAAETDVNFATMNPFRQGPMIASYKVYELHNCEFDYNSTTAAGTDMLNDEPFNPTYNIGIFFDDMYEVRHNEFLSPEPFVLAVTNRRINVKPNDKYIAPGSINPATGKSYRMEDLEKSEEYTQLVADDHEEWPDAYKEQQEALAKQKKENERSIKKQQLIRQYGADAAGQKAYQAALKKLEKEWAKEDKAEAKKKEQEEKEKAKKDKAERKASASKRTAEEEAKFKREWEKKQREAEKRIEEQQQYGKLLEQSMDDEKAFNEWFTKGGGQGMPLERARQEYDKARENEIMNDPAKGASFRDKGWSDMYPMSTPNEDEQFIYEKEPGVDTTYGLGQFLLKEIGDLVMVDTIAWNTWGDDGNGAMWGEPFGTPQPGQDGWRTDNSLDDPVSASVHSILNTGATFDKGMGNLFGLSIDTIDTYTSVTDSSSASVLKYNYNGHGNPLNLGNIVREHDSYDYFDDPSNPNYNGTLYERNSNHAGIGKEKANTLMGNLRTRHDRFDYFDDPSNPDYDSMLFETNSNRTGIGKVRAALMLGNLYQTMSLMSNT